jgi:hypothetical protein
VILVTLPRHLRSGRTFFRLLRRLEAARRCVIRQCEEYDGMNEQIKFPSQDEIRDAVLLVLTFPPQLR